MYFLENFASNQALNCLNILYLYAKNPISNETPDQESNLVNSKLNGAVRNCIQNEIPDQQLPRLCKMIYDLQINHFESKQDINIIKQTCEKKELETYQGSSFRLSLHLLISVQF